jgi:hypothetical protein
MIDPTSVHMSGFLRRIIESIFGYSSHLVLTVSPIFLEIGKVESSFPIRTAQNCEIAQ